jgi:hypothetical protein
VLLPALLGLVLVGDDRRRAGGRSGRCPPRRAPPGVDDRLADVVGIASSSPDAEPGDERSQAKRSSRARSVGAVPTSIASQDFELIFLLFRAASSHRCDWVALPEE